MTFLAGFILALMCVYVYLGFVAHMRPSYGVHPLPRHAMHRPAGAGAGWLPYDKHPTLPKIRSRSRLPETVDEFPLRPAATRVAGNYHGGAGVAAEGAGTAPDLDLAAKAKAKATERVPEAAAVQPTPPAAAAAVAAAVVGDLQSQPGPGIGRWEDGIAPQTHGSVR